MNNVEQISYGGRLIAVIVSAAASASETSFLTSSDATFQVGFVVYPAGGAVVPHVHLPVAREVIGTAEFLTVRSGRCIVDIYGDDRVLVCSRQLESGDAVLSLGGGHGFRMLEDTILLELKQGPYSGVAEKERFQPDSASDRP